MSENNDNDANRRNFRFPCERMEYTKTVGKLLPDILTDIFTELEFDVVVNSQRANGVDMQICLEELPIVAIEVLNWSIGSRLSSRRKNKIIENLDEFPLCDKLLVHTVPLSNLDGIQEHGIQRIEIGYQVLPEAYYNFFSARNQIVRRRIDNSSTRAEIRARILEYLVESELTPPLEEDS